MQRKPRPPEEHLLSGEWGRLLFVGLYGFSVSFLFYLWQLSQGVELIEARSTTLTLAIVFELVLAYSVRSRLPLWKVGMFSNRWMVGATAVPLIIQLIVLYTPLAPLLHVGPLTLAQWGIVLLICFSSLLFFEIMKVIAKD